MTLAQAVFHLQSQSVARGFGGELVDLDAAVGDDGKTVSLWSHFYLDEPLFASFTLDDPADFDSGAIYARVQELISPTLAN